MNKQLRIGIIGGGPAGFMAAIRAAELNPQAAITIIEATSKPLAKVLISGGGRCNVTHNCFDPATLVQSYPRGRKELRGPFSRFSPVDTIEWFKRHGVELKTEADGRMFPVSNKSITIADCLLNQAKSLGVKLLLKTRVKTVTHTANVSPEFNLSLSVDNLDRVEKFDRLLLATGGSERSLKLAHSLGHKIRSPLPSLFTFEIRDRRLKDLAGLSFDNVKFRLEANGKIFNDRGPLLITHWGLSGPAILRLSAWAARELYEAKYQATLTVSMIGSRAEELREQLLKYASRNGKKQVSTGAELPISKRYWVRIVSLSEVADETTWNNLTKISMNLIVQELTKARFKIIGKGQFKDEFVTCGGVDLKSVDFKRMESKKLPGLFFAGEILNIDGITGGFNFQNAWTTGWLAGCAMAEA